MCCLPVYFSLVLFFCFPSSSLCCSPLHVSCFYLCHDILSICACFSLSFPHPACLSLVPLSVWGVLIQQRAAETETEKVNGACGISLCAGKKWNIHTWSCAVQGSLPQHKHNLWSDLFIYRSYRFCRIGINILILTPRCCSHRISL